MTQQRPRPGQPSLFSLRLIFVGLLTVSLVALARPAPRAVILRLDGPQTEVVGALEGNRWVAADRLSESTQAFIKAGFNISVVAEKGVLGKARAGGSFDRVPEGDPCDWVRTTSLSSGVQVPRFPAYAIAAPWNPVPRTIRSIPTTNSIYTSVMAKELAARNITSSVMLSQALNVDLDGDKVSEMILVAQNPKVSFDKQRMLEAQYEETVGNYSLVLVRKVIAGKVKTFVLGERVVRTLFDGSSGQAGQPTVLTQYVTAIADSNGDGRMEIFVDDIVHEGEGVSVFAWTGQGFKKTIGWGCGV